MPIKDGAREVESGLHVRRVGSSLHGECHLVTDRGERVAQDFEPDRISALECGSLDGH